MSTPQEQFQAFLELQRGEYRRALPDKLARLQSLWAAVAPDAAPQALTELERQAHTLAGTAGTLGFREVGLAARALEELLAQAGEGGAGLTPVLHLEISRTVIALRACLPAD